MDFQIASEDPIDNSAFVRDKKKASDQANLRMQLLGGPERFKYAVHIAMFYRDQNVIPIVFFFSVCCLFLTLLL